MRRITNAWTGWVVAVVLMMMALTGPQGGTTVPTVVGMHAEQIYIDNGNRTYATRWWRVIRVWSDGQVDDTRLRYVEETSCTMDNMCGPTVRIP